MAVAAQLLAVARGAGFRESGATWGMGGTRVMVGGRRGGPGGAWGAVWKKQNCTGGQCARALVAGVV